MHQAQNHHFQMANSPSTQVTPPPQDQSQIRPAVQGNLFPQPAEAETQNRGWEANKSSTLLVVATLITTLTYVVGNNPPGGFWQDDGPHGRVAGAPIMRDKNRRRYWLFMTANWVGFGDSMLLTMWLLTGAPVTSRRVRWSFAISYSSLQLTYITSMHGTSLCMDIATWAGVLLIIWLATRIRRQTDNEVDFFTRMRNKALQAYEWMRG